MPQAKQAIEEIIAQLSDPEPNVRANAARTLGKRKRGDVFDALVKAMADPEYKVRAAATRALGKRNDPRAMEVLIKALKDKSTTVRIAAVQYLIQTGNERAIGPLVPMLKAHACHLHRPAFEAMLRFGKAAIPHLAAALNEKDAVISKAFVGENFKSDAITYHGVIVRLLGLIGHEDAIAPLMQVLNNPDPVLQRLAKDSLANIHKPT